MSDGSSDASNGIPVPCPSVSGVRPHSIREIVREGGEDITRSDRPRHEAMKYECARHYGFWCSRRQTKSANVRCLAHDGQQQVDLRLSRTGHNWTVELFLKTGRSSLRVRNLQCHTEMRYLFGIRRPRNVLCRLSDDAGS
jgi:hypothetical protein